MGLYPYALMIPSDCSPRDLRRLVNPWLTTPSKSHTFPSSSPHHRLNATLQSIIHIPFRLIWPAQIDLWLAIFPHKLEPHVHATPLIPQLPLGDDSIQPIIADPLGWTIVPSATPRTQHTNWTAVVEGSLQGFGRVGHDGVAGVFVESAVAAGVVEYVTLVFVEHIVVTCACVSVEEIDGKHLSDSLDTTTENAPVFSDPAMPA